MSVSYLYAFAVRAVVNVAWGHARAMEVQQDFGTVLEGPRHRAGHEVVVLIEGYNDVADTDQLNRLLPDFGADFILVVDAVRPGFEIRVKWPHVDGDFGAKTGVTFNNFQAVLWVN